MLLYTLTIDNLFPTSNDVLTVVGALTDADGTANAVFVYQWQSSNDNGRRGQTLRRPTIPRLAARHRGRASTAGLISFTDDEGQPEVVETAATDAVGDIIRGTNAAETLTGTAGGDDITARRGNDIVNALGGNDLFIATVNDGNDTYNGGAGIDTYDLSGTTAVATSTS